MFFAVSKTFWFFLQPLNLSLFLIAIGLAAAVFKWRRLGIAAVVTAFSILAVASWSSIGDILLAPLENRFAPPSPLPEKVAGIVLLGGGMDGRVSVARGRFELNASGDRLAEVAVLARRYPEAKIIISGGPAALGIHGAGDADLAPSFLRALGVPKERLILDNRSRDTYENAIFSRELATPEPGETWLLVTSAFHMPRAIGAFRKADFPVTAWPVDYHSTGREGLELLKSGPLEALQNTSTALREWIGLLAYRATGRI